MYLGHLAFHSGVLLLQTCCAEVPGNLTIGEIVCPMRSMWDLLWSVKALMVKKVT